MPEFGLQLWPVADENIRICNLMVEEGRWQCNPLAAYQEGVEGVVPPSKYPSLLPGCTAHILFMIACHRLRKKTRFTAHVEEIIIIREPETFTVVYAVLSHSCIRVSTSNRVWNTLNECDRVVLIGSQW